MGNFPNIEPLEYFCGENLASIRQLGVIRAEEVISVPEPPHGSHIISGSLQLKPGADFIYFDFPPDVVKFDEPDKETPNGTVYFPKISGELNRQSPDSSLGIQKLQDGYYVITALDFNGFKRIIGAPDNPVRFSSKGKIDQSRPQDNGYQFTFLGQSQFPAYFLDTGVGMSNCAAVSMADFDTAPWEVDTNDNNRLEKIQVQILAAGLIQSTTLITANLYDDNNTLVGTLEWDQTVSPIIKYEPATGGPFYISGTWRIEIPNYPIHLKTGEDCTFNFVQTQTLSPINQVPVASNVQVNGIMEVGENITATWGYFDNEADPEGASVVEIYSYTSQFNADNNQSATLIHTGNIYQLSASEDTQYIRAKVVPVSPSGNSPGLESWSPTYGPVVAYQSFPFKTIFDPNNPIPNSTFDTMIVYGGADTPQWKFPNGTIITGASITTNGTGLGLDGSEQTVTLQVLDLSLVSVLRIEKDEISGVLDISPLTHLSELRCFENQISSLIGWQITQNFTLCLIKDNPITGTLDLSAANFTNCDMNASLLQISNLVLPASASWRSFRWEDCVLLQSVSFVGQSFQAGTANMISFERCTALVTVTPPLISAGSTQYFKLLETSISTVDLTNIQVKKQIELENCLNLSSIIFGNQVNDLYQLRIFDNPNLSGVIDLTGFSFLPTLIFGFNTQITELHLPIDPNTAIEKIDCSNSALNRIVNLASCILLPEKNNFILDVSDCGMSAAEVNQILVDMDTITTGAFTGREIKITGNTAPDATSGGVNGQAAAISLAAKNILVYTD